MGIRRSVSWAFLLIFLGITDLASAQQQYFEPLQDTLNRFGIRKLPTADDYPDVPAVAVLSFHEYRQLGIKHERRTHTILKILSAQGKEYTTVQIPCFAKCEIRGRTVKPDGTIISLQGKDIIRTERLTKYSSPYYLAQFALPSVEPEDLIEYIADVEYPYPFMLSDFRFAEPYPIAKAVFVLTHPQDYAYAYVLHQPPGSSRIDVSRDNLTIMNNAFLRTTFVANNVRAALEEPHSPGENRSQPGMRILIQSQSGRRYESFDSWFNYGDLIAEQTGGVSLSTPELRQLIQKATEQTQNVESIIAKIYSELDQKIDITDDTLITTSFEFQSPEQTMQQKTAAPHDFAFLLAACFRMLQWKSDLILVNSHQQEESSENNVFPPDLDLVFLNVVVDGSEFLLDCNQNGMPAFALSSESMNRFALGIPLFHQKSGVFNSSDVYTTRMPYRDTNKNRMAATATAAPEGWEIDFRWTLEGEYRAPFAVLSRQVNEDDFRRKLFRFVRSRILAEDLKDLKYRFETSLLEITGRAFLPRKRSGANLELLQNEFWNPDFDYRPYVLENRTIPLLLPVAGEISFSFRAPGGKWILPDSVRIESKPVQYSLTSKLDASSATIDERMIIQDLEVKPSSFQKFAEFLDAYYANHFWSMLLAVNE